jgi:hypothetical protein
LPAACHVDLAADLDPVRPIVTCELSGDIINCAGIGSDVLTHLPITARCCPHQPAILIGEAERETVDLRFSRDDEFLIGGKTKVAANAGDKLFDILIRKGIVERQHRHAVRDLGKGFGNLDPDPVAWTVGPFQMREAGLDFEVARTQPVIVGI